MNGITPDGKTVGRKFVGLIIDLVLLLAGLLIINKLAMGIAFFEAYAKWTSIGYGIFVGGNAGITATSLLSSKKEVMKEQ